MRLWKILPLLLALPCLCHFLHAQNEFFNDGADVYVQANALVYVQGQVINDDQGGNIGRIHNSGDVQLEGNWENRSATSLVYDNLGTGTTTFLGANPVQTIGGTQVTNFNNLTISKPGVTEVRQLINSGNDRVLNLTNDFLNTQNFIFGVANTAANAIQRTGPITPNYTNSLTQGYVTSTPGSGGRLSRATVPATTYFFPVGHATNTRFRPVEITPLSGALNAYSIQFVNIATPNQPNLGPGINSVLPDWYHFIERQNAAGAPSESIRIYWDNPNDNACDPNTVLIGEYDGSLWQNTGAVTTVALTAPNLSHTTNAVYPGTYPGSPFTTNQFVLADNTYGPWGGLCVFPVELIDLRADPLSESILVSWQTLNETNNLGFDLMKSEDGINFTFVDFIQGQGDSDSPQGYSFEDEDVEFNKTYYYQLHQRDFNGMVRPTDVVEAMIVADPTLEISDFYPNPGNGNNYLRIVAPKEMEVTLRIFNPLGQDIFGGSFELKAGVNEVPFSFGELAAGHYLASLQAEGVVFHRRFIVE